MKPLSSQKAINLLIKERKILAEQLIQSVEGVPLTEVEEAWVKEAERRFKAWRRGERKGVLAKRAFRQIRKEFGW